MIGRPLLNQYWILNLIKVSNRLDLSKIGFSVKFLAKPVFSESVRHDAQGVRRDGQRVS